MVETGVFPLGGEYGTPEDEEVDEEAILTGADDADDLKEDRRFCAEDFRRMVGRGGSVKWDIVVQRQATWRQQR